MEMISFFDKTNSGTNSKRFGFIPYRNVCRTFDPLLFCALLCPPSLVAEDAGNAGEHVQRHLLHLGVRRARAVEQELDTEQIIYE
jgi:hypothetical protein